MGSNQQKFLLIGLAVVGIILLLMNIESSPEKPEEVVAPPRFSGQVPIDTDSIRQKISAATGRESGHSLIAEGSWKSTLGYSALSLNVVGAKKIGLALAALYDQDIVSIRVTARSAEHQIQEPALEFAGNVEAGFSPTLSIDKFLTGFSPILSDGSVGIDLDLIYQLKDGSRQIVENAFSLDVSPEAAKSAVLFKGSDGATLGHIELELVTRGPLLAGKLSGDLLDYDAVMSSDMGRGRTLKDALEDYGSALKNFWAAGTDDFDQACSSLRQTLILDIGLTSADATTALLAITSRHALFGSGMSYETACLDSETARALEQLDTDFPGTVSKTNVSGSNLTQLLGRVGSLMRSSNPDRARGQLEDLFTDSVLIRDPHGLIGGMDGIEAFEANGQSILPSATPEAGAEYLLSLPVAKFACFSSGTGMSGAHRAGLVQFSGDPAIWVLDLAFDSDARIAGVSIQQAGRKEICRAIATRTTPESQCYFSKNGPITPAQCR